MDYRVENKYLVTDAYLAVIQSRIKNFMPQDEHQDGECYEIRSLYFDDMWDNCMDENEAGVDDRQKYRMRIYNACDSVIHLEIKEKENSYVRKQSCSITREEALSLINGEADTGMDSRAVFNRFRLARKIAGLKPVLNIDYERTAFVYPSGNVRITFDRNITASRSCGEFFEKTVTGKFPLLPSGYHILEIKYDELIPDFIVKQLDFGRLQQTAFSKYYLGRLAVNGVFPEIL